MNILVTCTHVVVDHSIASPFVGDEGGPGEVDVDCFSRQFLFTTSMLPRTCMPDPCVFHNTDAHLTPLEGSLQLAVMVTS
jgi:hypothetical protein